MARISSWNFGKVLCDYISNKICLLIAASYKKLYAILASEILLGDLPEPSFIYDLSEQ